LVKNLFLMVLKGSYCFRQLVIMVLLSLLYSSCHKENDALPVLEPLFFNPLVTYGIITDQDSNFYETVTIGEQVWMAENLKTTIFNDSTLIPEVTDNEEWFNLKTPGFCWYGNRDSIYKDVCGGLYNWYAVNTKKLCPLGWHVPSKEDWATLINYLGDDSSGVKIREVGDAHWHPSDVIGTNESGFTAVSNGLRWFNGFKGYGFRAAWWTSSEYDSSNAYIYNLRYDFTYVGWATFSKESGNSIRCIKNSPKNK